MASQTQGSNARATALQTSFVTLLSTISNTRTNTSDIFPFPTSGGEPSNTLKIPFTTPRLNPGESACRPFDQLPCAGGCIDSTSRCCPGGEISCPFGTYCYSRDGRTYKCCLNGRFCGDVTFLSTGLPTYYTETSAPTLSVTSQPTPGGSPGASAGITGGTIPSIVGGVLGTAVILCIVLFVVLRVRKQRRRQKAMLLASTEAASAGTYPEMKLVSPVATP